MPGARRDDYRGEAFFYADRVPFLSVAAAQLYQECHWKPPGTQTGTEAPVTESQSPCARGGKGEMDHFEAPVDSLQHHGGWLSGFF